MSDSPPNIHRIVVDVPLTAGDAVIDRISDAVGEAAFEAQPDDREAWDITVYGTNVHDDIYDR